MKAHQTNQKSNDMLMVAHHVNEAGTEMITVGRKVGYDVEAIQVHQNDKAKELYEKINYGDQEKSKDQMEMYNLVFASPKDNAEAVLLISKLHETDHKWVRLDILYGDRASEIYAAMVEADEKAPEVVKKNGDK